jgi:hypothetical protein
MDAMAMAVFAAATAIWIWRRRVVATNAARARPNR